MRQPMRPLSEMPAAVAAGIHTVFSDIDDTLTTEGQLTVEAYAALAALREAGLRVVLVTGRPAGWCDHIARMWPVDAVIGENGAFYFWYEAGARKLMSRHVFDEAVRAANTARMAAGARDHPARGARLRRSRPTSSAACTTWRSTSARTCRRCPTSAVQRIVELMERAGMTAKVSSIHVNGWFGQYDKLSMAHLLLRERYGMELEAERDRCVFAGDSPNDAPMFAYLPNAVGVANVARFDLPPGQAPAYVTPSPAGAGFAELARFLIQAR